MSWLIALLRTKVNDSSASIWTDDQLQDYLDMHRVHVRRELLSKDADEKLYCSRFGMFEDDITLWDGNAEGAAQVPPEIYSANLVDGVFTFASDQNKDHFLDGKSYNLHGAIAECLEQLAMDQNKARMWERGGVSYTHYDLMEMARYHRNLAGERSTTVVRTYRKS